MVFVPVALNYDQVIEDRFLIKAGKDGKRRFRPPAWTVIKSVSTYFWRRITGQFKGFGTASVAFGTPLALSSLGRRNDLTEEVAEELMARIRKVVPVLAAPLVARAMIEHDAWTRANVSESITQMLDALKVKKMPLPRRNVDALIEDTLARFTLRNLIEVDGGTLRPKNDGREVLAYYAETIAHHFEPARVSAE